MNRHLEVIPMDFARDHTLASQALATREAPSNLLMDATAGQHRTFLQNDFWRTIPGYREISRDTFLDHSWQEKNAVRRPAALAAVLGKRVAESFYDDFAEGLRRSPMSVRVTPYIISLINWDDPYHDPLRTQFIPIGTRLLPDHPRLAFDSLAEQSDSPVSGLTHRYHDKALFLALSTCPVYCRYCTRSYSVGLETEQSKKLSFVQRDKRWTDVFRYIAQHQELEDIVVSGGDAYQLRAQQIREVGEALLRIEHVRRIRFATKGPVVLPQKILTDHDWFDALRSVTEFGRRHHKEVCLHTHFNHPREITDLTRQALNKLYEIGIRLRNQSVLLRGVNDNADTMKLLVKKLGYMNLSPYYVYVHDLVKGVEDLRTRVQTGIDIEKQIRGVTAGYNTPTFVVDTPNGGGKRDIHSFEHYDKENGIAVYTAPSVKPGYFLYFDPIDLLPEASRERWGCPRERERMIRTAIEHARNA